MQPILIGKCFLVELSENMNTFDHDSVLAFMKIKFPESEYIPIITKLLEEKKLRNNAPKQSFATIIDGSNIYSLKDLTQTSSLKGKKLFIDLWETNCSPCKYEFQFNKKLHDILNKYDNVVKVYISLDNEKNDSIWRDMIGFYKLDSYNIRANYDLSKDIKEKIYNGGSMMVPRFVLLDSDSQLLGNRLPNPSKGNLLENALDKILNQ
jgi:thiol-disulfide isomerase/thioredoxin